MTMRVHMLFGTVTTALVVGTVVWGFVVVGSPDTRRLLRLDERRIEDLQTIHAEIQLLVRDPDDAKVLRRPLPAALKEAAAAARAQKLPLADPETGEPYGYAVRDGHRYELTATFALPRDVDHEVFWNHPAGPHTFTIDVLDPP